MLLHLSLFCLFIQELLSLTGASESGILGGKTAKSHSRPYMASLQVRGAHKCGGFLIRKDFILTAAHCTKDSRSLTVVLGHNNVKKKKSQKSGIKVKWCYSHPSNSRNQYDFDIALCKLVENATLNKKVNVIELPKQGESIQDQTKCLILGWGMTKPKGAAEDNLREVTVPVQSNGECKKSWRDHFNEKTMLCTKSDGKRGFCQGDSGGPLVCNKKAYGIASFVADPCTALYPNVYVNISHFISWLTKMMKKN